MTANGTNDNRFNDLLKQAEAWGKDQAAGKESMTKLFIACVKNAQDGVLTLDKDSHKRDQISYVYERFGKGTAKRVFGEKVSNSTSSQESKMRNAVKLGQMTTIDAYAEVAKWAQWHKERADADLDVKGAYSSIVDCAKAQLKEDSALTQDAVVGLITPSKQDKTVESELKRVEKILERLITGEGGVVCQDESVIKAHELVRDTVAAFTLAEKKAKAIAEMAELGLVVVDAEQVAA